MKSTLILSSLLTLPILDSQLKAHELTTNRPDGHAPIGVMADHTHKTGEWMASYRYMHMFMDGNRSDTYSIAVGDVLAGWPVSPLEMTMEMHMVGLMYAPSDEVTFMAMLPFTYLTMDHITRTGVRFTTETGGLSDQVSVSSRLDYLTWGNIRGADPRINPAVVATADPDRRAGERLDLLFGVNLMATEGFLKGHRIAIEGGP